MNNQILYLENALRESKGVFLIGNQLTIGDIAIAHHFIGMQVAQVKLDLEPYLDFNHWDLLFFWRILSTTNRIFMVRSITK